MYKLLFMDVCMTYCMWSCGQLISHTKLRYDVNYASMQFDCFNPDNDVGYAEYSPFG